MPAFVSTGIQATLLRHLTSHAGRSWPGKRVDRRLHLGASLVACLGRPRAVDHGAHPRDRRDHGGQNVTVAGLVNFVRQHVTKKGERWPLPRSRPARPLEVVSFRACGNRARSSGTGACLDCAGKVSFRGRIPAFWWNQPPTKLRRLTPASRSLLRLAAAGPGSPTYQHSENSGSGAGHPATGSDL